MKVFITGICGFAGSTLAESLAERAEGVEIFGMDNFIRPGSERNRERLRGAGMRVWHGDVRSAADFETLPAADWVIDAAANPSVLAGVDGKFSSRQLIEHNLGGTLNTLEYCKRHGAGMVLLSSSRVYSVNALAALPLRVRDRAFELDTTRALPAGVTAAGIEAGFSVEPPVSLYGGTKLASEILALEYAAAFQFPVWIDRCGVLAGAGQFGTAEQGIFSFWIHSHQRRRALRYIGFEGSGRQSRDALHPRDLAALVHAQMACGRTGGRRLYTAGGGRENLMSLAQLTAWCDARFGPHAVGCDPNPRRYDVPWIAMSNAAAAADFGWSPATGIGSILEEIAANSERHPDWLRLSGVE
jgi:CDP-paratose 2-epimerase